MTYTTVSYVPMRIIGMLVNALWAEGDFHGILDKRVLSEYALVF